MNLRSYPIALAMVFLPMKSLQAQPPYHSFSRADFVHAEKTVKNGQVLVRFDLSEKGKEKVRVFNKTDVGKTIAMNVAGKTRAFTLRVPITGDSLETGPFEPLDADRVIQAVNTR